jgi:DNA polymerase III alpha subunit
VVEIPKNATKLLQHAVEHGWAGDIRTATGQGMQLREVEQVVVRLRRDGHRLAGIWWDGRWEAGLSKDPLLVMNQTEIKAAIAVPPEEYVFTMDVEPDTLHEKMRDEYEYARSYISGHPLDLVNMRAWPDVVSTNLLHETDPGTGHYMYEEGEELQFMGLVEELKVKKTRRGGDMATFTLTDHDGGVRCVAFGAGYQDMKAGMLVAVKGVITERQVKTSTGDVIDDDAAGIREFKVKTAVEVAW